MGRSIAEARFFATPVIPGRYTVSTTPFSKTFGRLYPSFCFLALPVPNIKYLNNSKSIFKQYVYANDQLPSNTIIMIWFDKKHKNIYIHDVCPYYVFVWCYITICYCCSANIIIDVVLQYLMVNIQYTIN